MCVAKTFHNHQRLFEQFETGEETEHLIDSMHLLRAIIACEKIRPQMHTRCQVCKKMVGVQKSPIAY